MNRTIDELGRIVLPKEVRKAFKITTQTLIKIEYDDKHIILTPIRNKISCSFCDATIDSTDSYCYNCGSKENKSEVLENDK